MICLTTNQGTIELELDSEKAPITAKNFERYVTEGFYDGTIFHRVIKGFMIQGGGFTAGMSEKLDSRSDRERGEERPEERQVHDRDGPHE